MSWVIATAVLPSRFTQSTISPSITAPMIGSSPVVGSSKNRMSGCAAMARASATRFCMPPDSSAGDSVADARRPARPGRACRPPAPRACRREPCAPGQQAEGHVLPDRQAVEQRAVLEQHADLRAAPPRCSPPRQAQHVLAVDLDRARRPARSGRGCISAAPTCRSPTRRSPPSRCRRPTSRSMPSSTVLSPKDLRRPRMRSSGLGIAHRRRTAPSARSRTPGSGSRRRPRRWWWPRPRPAAPPRLV